MDGNTLTSTRNPASRQRPAPVWRSIERAAPFAGTIVVMLLIWVALARLSGNETILPGPGRVLATFSGYLARGTLIRHTAASLGRILISWLLAAAVAVPLGILMGRNPRLERYLRPGVELLRPISPLAWIPLAVLWFGIGLTGKVFVIFIAAFFPILLNTIAGLQRINPILLKAATTFGCSPLETTLRVCIPAALPTIGTGLRISFGSAWMAIISAEMVASKSGLGYMIIDGMEILRSDIVITGMIAIGVLGFAFDSIFRLVERLLAWGE